MSPARLDNTKYDTALILTTVAARLQSLAAQQDIDSNTNDAKRQKPNDDSNIDKILQLYTQFDDQPYQLPTLRDQLIQLAGTSNDIMTLYDISQIPNTDIHLRHLCEQRIALLQTHQAWSASYYEVIGANDEAEKLDTSIDSV